MEIAAICPETIGKHLVPDMDGADIKRAREALNRAYEEAAERLLRPADDITVRLDNLAQSLAGEYPPHTLMDLAEAASLITMLRRTLPNTQGKA
jgi:hypothetical protein